MVAFSVQDESALDLGLEATLFVNLLASNALFFRQCAGSPPRRKVIEPSFCYYHHRIFLGRFYAPWSSLFCLGLYLCFLLRRLVSLCHVLIGLMPNSCCITYVETLCISFESLGSCIMSLTCLERYFCVLESLCLKTSFEPTFMLKLCKFCCLVLANTSWNVQPLVLLTSTMPL